MTVTLTTVPDVELASTGTYPLSSGEHTFTAEDLADAVRAYYDPTVPAPRLKLGHADPRFAEAVASGELDGEPAFGTAVNLRLSDDGQHVYGDYVDVPEWLAPMLKSAYPGRSIEGPTNWTAPSGRKYRLAIANVALLGVKWPGITSLADLKEVMQRTGPVPAASGVEGAVEYAGGSASTFVIARMSRPAERAPEPHGVHAGIDIGSIRQAFVTALDAGQITAEGIDGIGEPTYWWPRSLRAEDDGSLAVIVDDDSGHLLRIPVQINAGAVSYGKPELVQEKIEPVGGTSQALSRTLASWGATDGPAHRQERHPMELNDQQRAALRKRLKLADDADDQTILSALTADGEGGQGGEGQHQEEVTPTAGAGEGGSGNGEGAGASGGTNNGEVVPVGAAAGGGEAEAGFVRVDRETWERVRTGAEQGAAVAASIAAKDKADTISQAVRDGKLPPSRREHYEAMWDRDPEGTKTLLTASVEQGGLAAGLVPVGTRGRSGDGEGGEGVEAEHQDLMRRLFPQEAREIEHRARVEIREERV